VTDAPRFAVVGRVNKGKSSIVATLAEDDSVRIDPRPGTTTEVREYPVRVDGRPLFVLVDTPGFEDAPRALAWLRAREVSAADRPARVAELLRAHEGTADFLDERRLLAPILAGANVLYVVDGTRPFRRNYEAEMEILRWTGQPGMALVNRIGAEDHAAEWRRALDQYFKIVRDFDAYSVTFDERLSLLESFRELRPGSRQAIDEAVTALVAQRRRRRGEAAAEIAELIADELTHTEEVAVEDEAALEAERDRLERGFHDHLRSREEKARRRIEGLYRHSEVRFEGAALERPVFQQDLFAEETWKLLGLSPAELVAAGTLAGAAVGGALDLMVGGASVMAGTAIGGAVGGATALVGIGRRFARVRPVGPGGLAGWMIAARRYWEGGRRFRIGPHAQPNFPWVLLDRALLHYDGVARRTHARRGTIAVADGGGRAGIVADFARAERRELEEVFRRIRRSAGDPRRELRDDLERAVARILTRIDPVSGESPERAVDLG
jgi:GTPase Era involved in 16S rRNA processing